MFFLFMAVGLVGTVLFVSGRSASAGENDVMPFNRYDSLFKKWSGVTGVPWRWLKAVCMVESSLGQNPRVATGLSDPFNVSGSTSSDGKSWGLMQVTLNTARDMQPSIGIPDLNNPDKSVELGARYLEKMIDRFGIDDRESVIRAYNGGPGFRSTVQGVRDTPGYYSKFVSKLNQVMLSQPGEELES